MQAFGLGHNFIEARPERFLPLSTDGGFSFVARVIGAGWNGEKRLLVIRWGFRNYDFELSRNRLLGVKVRWRADKSEAARVFEEITSWYVKEQKELI